MKRLNIWGPWKNNPSKKENFYSESELKEEIFLKEDLEIDNKIDENIIEDIIEEKETVSNKTRENSDPYFDILKDL